MTAAAIVIEPHRAFVWTDTGRVDLDGMVSETGPMTWPVQGMKAAVTCFGCPGFADHLAAAMSEDAAAGQSFDDVLEAGGAVDACRRLLETLKPFTAAGVLVWVVGWSEAHGAPRCLQFCNIPGTPFAPGWSLSLGEFLPALSDAAIEQLYDDVGPTSGQGFDVARLGRPVMDAQRSHAARDLKPVGMILETVISADGVTRDVVHGWPEDVIGEPFQPARRVPLAVSMSPAREGGLKRIGRGLKLSVRSLQ